MLVGVDSDVMGECVRKEIGMLAEKLFRPIIHIPVDHPDLPVGEAIECHTPDQLIEVPLRLGNPLHENHSGHIRTVSSQDASHVDEDLIGILEPSVGAVDMMGVCAVLGEGDDGLEALPFRTALEVQDLYPFGDLRLGHSDADPCCELLEGKEVDRLGFPNEIDLPRCLHAPEFSEDARHRRHGHYPAIEEGFFASQRRRIRIDRQLGDSPVERIESLLVGDVLDPESIAGRILEGPDYERIRKQDDLPVLHQDLDPFDICRFEQVFEIRASREKVLLVRIEGSEEKIEMHGRSVMRYDSVISRRPHLSKHIRTLVPTDSSRGFPRIGAGQFLLWSAKGGLLRVGMVLEEEFQEITAGHLSKEALIGEKTIFHFRNSRF